MINRMTKALTLSAVLTLLACSSSAQQNGTAGSDVIGRVGDRAITLKEVEDRWQKAEPAEHAETIQKLYEGRRKALDEVIAEMLFAEAAKGKGLSPAAYEEAELSRRAKTVTDADVASFYTSNIKEMQGRPLEAVAPLINRYLQEQYRTDGPASAHRRAAEGRAIRSSSARGAEAIRRSRSDRSFNRHSLGAGDDRGVLRLPVSILPAREPDVETRASDLRRQGAHRLEGLPADTDPRHTRSRQPRPPIAPGNRGSSGSITIICLRIRRRSGSMRSRSTRRTSLSTRLDLPAVWIHRSSPSGCATAWRWALDSVSAPRPRFMSMDRRWPVPTHTRRSWRS